MTHFPDGFLRGAATAAHEVEGGNVGNDHWEAEHAPHSPFAEPSGDACDSWHRWPEDLDLVAVDRRTFARTAKPSLAWLGGVAARNGLP